MKGYGCVFLFIWLWVFKVPILKYFTDCMGTRRGGKTDRAIGRCRVFHNEITALWLSIITGLIQ